MKVVKFVVDLGEFKAGEILEVEDQIACSAIAAGYAVPSVESPMNARQAPEVAPEPAIETVAEDAAPEVKAEE